jgi:hypothetical protein
VKTIYTHSGDLDGLVAGMLLTRYFPEARVVPLNYGKEHLITEFPCVIADLNLKDDHPALARQGNILVDHHAHHPEAKCQQYYAPDACAAMLVWRQFYQGRRVEESRSRGVEPAEGPGGTMVLQGAFCPEAWARAWAELADPGDRFVKVAPLFEASRRFSALLRLAGWEWCWEHFQQERPGHPALMLAASMAEAAEKSVFEKAVAAARRSLHVLPGWAGETPGLPGAVLIGVLPAGSISEVAAALLEELPGKTVALVMLGSLMSETGKVSVGIRGPRALEVAKAFGGGGHPEAAGFQVEAEVIIGAICGAATAAGATESSADGRR